MVSCVCNCNGFLFQGQRIMDFFKFNAIITTYETILSEIELLSQIEWRVCIIDEAHRLKNRGCKLLEGLKCLDLVGSKRYLCEKSRNEPATCQSKPGKYPAMFPFCRNIGCYSLVLHCRITWMNCSVC